ncbi:hypothetical protein C6495_00020 [Candidatus Poribacteria bacterium]|nr:MAG: hypothetical protein C6495_00020 [Candidatus Poribacteria bacterium]
MFWEQITTHYRAGSAHQFLLHFNVQDLHYDDAYGYLPAMPYLMEQLNLLGCDLVVGYNSVQGIIFPNVRQWRRTQKMLEIVPPDAADEVPLPDERSRINSNLAIGKLHEDPVVTMEPHPSEELQNRLSHLLRQGRAKVGLIINFLEQLAPNHPSLTSGANDESQRFLNLLNHWASDLDIRRRKQIILLVTQNTFDIHPSLTVNPEIPVVEMPFPDYAQRLKFIAHLHAISPDDAPMRESLGDARAREEFARETAGLNLFGIHDIARQAATTQQEARGELLLNYRQESIKTFSHGVLEVGEPREVARMQGPSHVNRAIQDIADGLKQGDWRRIPRGVLLLGPAGTGKVFIAKLLAGKAETAFVQLRYASQVGEVAISVNGNEGSYERNLIAALSFIRGIAPVVVFIDEIEQASPHTSMQPEQGERGLPVSLVNAMSDTSLRGKVLWVGATNRPDLMPAIFRRTGIFDHKLILLPPTPFERAAILKIFCEPRTQESIDYQSIIGDERTDGITARDLWLIMQRARNLALRNNREQLIEADLREAVDDFVPDHSREMQQFMGLLAMREANSRAMLPDALLPQYQEFVEDNRIDKTKINRRLLELSGELGLQA